MNAISIFVSTPISLDFERLVHSIWHKNNHGGLDMVRLGLLSAVLIASCAITPAFAQEAPQTAMTAEAEAQYVVIKKDTPVQMMATKEISTADVGAGTKFRLRINEAIIVGGNVIVPVGAWATGEVVSATSSGALGKSGTMSARLLFVELDDARIPLLGDMQIKGQGAGSAAAAVIFSGVTGLFHRGNNAKIKAGELVHGFVAEDVTLNMASNPVRRIEGAQ
jgi:hypothetical protein